MGKDTKTSKTDGTRSGKRFHDARKRLDEITKRIGPYVKAPARRIYTTEGQWRSTADRLDHD